MKILRRPLNLTLMACALSGLLTQHVTAGDAMLEANPIKPIAQGTNPLEQIMVHQLLEASMEYAAGNTEHWAKAVNLPLQLANKDQVYIEIFADPKRMTSDMKSMVASFGGTIRDEFTSSWAEVSMPVKNLLTLAERAQGLGVTYVRLARLIHTTATSEAVKGSRADRWKGPAELTGLGVKIGVIDYFDPALLAVQQSRNEIARFNFNPVPDSPVSSHGNNVLEVIYDFANRSDYELFPAGATAGSIRNAIDAARRARVDVLSMSVGTEIDGYNDGTALPGTVTEKLKAAFDEGIFITMAAGNSAQSHWAGRFETSAATTNELNWNSNVFTNTSVNTSAWGTQSLNRLTDIATDSECIPNGRMLIVRMVHQRQIGGLSGFAIRLLREVQTGPGTSTWHTVDYDAGSNQTPERAIVYTANNQGATYSTTLERTMVASTSPGCASGTAKYAIQVLRQLTGGNGNFALAPYYLQLFVHPDLSLQFSIPQSSIFGTAASPSVYSVGAAECNAYTNNRSTVNDCNSLRMAGYSGQGPIAAIGGNIPVIPPSSTLATDPAVLSQIKPDSSSFANVTTSLSMQPDGSYLPFAGTSAATPHVAGMVALILERNSVFKGAPTEVKLVLDFLSTLRSADQASRGYSSHPSYVYGRGLARFQKESRLEFRGRPNNTRTFRLMTASPANAPPNGTVRFSDGLLSNRILVRFKDEQDRPVLYPSSEPTLSLTGGAAGTLPTDLTGGRASLHMFPMSTTHPGMAHIEHGYFEFNQLGINRIPADSTGRPIMVAGTYDLRMGMQSIYGTQINQASLPSELRIIEGGTASFYVCSATAVDARCPQ